MVVTDGKQISYENNVVHLPSRTIGRLLSQSSRSARLTGFTTIVASHSATTPFTECSLRLIKRYLSHFFADTDANFRSEVSSLIQRLLDRLRAVTAVLARQDDRHGLGEFERAQSVLRYHRGFLDWLLLCLTWELRPTASYQRHISALRCLSVVTRSGLDSRVAEAVFSKAALGDTRWPFVVTLMTPGLRSLLLDLLVDPFDDVRQTAASILAMYSSSSGEDAWQDVQLARKRAEMSMLLTGRADQADGVAHLHALQFRMHRSFGEQLENSISPLVNQLDSMLDIAASNLSQAVARFPIHGLLTSIRYICQQNASVLANATTVGRLTSSLQRVWSIAKPILCNDAPEGYLPEDFENEADVSTKDTLSYCWRALKEASLLLGVIITFNTPAGPSDDANALEHRSVLSELCFTELAELRHRGAFSTVAQTWALCCVQVTKASHGQATLEQWYDKTLSMLRNNSTINTRRSAGLPSLLCGILVANGSGDLIIRAFSDLDAISRMSVDAAAAGEGSMAQVHAMNCMKDILKHSRLGEQSEPHVPQALRLAADALRFKVWAVRNCGLMLVRAVIDRLVGTSETFVNDSNAGQKKLSVEEHPQLLDIVMGLLESTHHAGDGMTISNNEGVFPALQLLQRLQVPEKQAVAVEEAVFALTANPVWHIREKAARTYASLVSSADTADVLRSLFATMSKQQNAMHGALLCAKHAVQTFTSSLASTFNEVSLDSDKKGAELIAKGCSSVAITYSQAYHENYCAITKGAYIDVLMACEALSRIVGKQPTTVDEMHRPGFNHMSIVGELEHSVRPDQFQDPAGAALRLALARSLALKLTDRSGTAVDEYIPVITRLVTVDDDAGAGLLEALEVHQSNTTGVHTEVATIAFQINGHVLGLPGISGRVRHQALSTLLSTASTCDDPAKRNFCALWSTEHSQKCFIDQACAGLELQVQSLCIDMHLDDGATAPKRSHELHSWVDSIATAVAGRGIYTCEAAALALDGTRLAWTSLDLVSTSDHALQRLYVAAYDLLNDDDEDIRSLGSRITSRILASQTKGKSCPAYDPLVAGQKIATLMVNRWPTSSSLAELVMLRAFGLSEDKIANVADTFAEYSKEDMTLFAEEKQNLYIDEAREVRMWSRMATRLHPRSISRKSIRSLSTRVTDGLKTLAQLSSSKTSTSISSNPEVFTLGLQIIYGVQFLLHLAKAGQRIPVRPSMLRHQLGILIAAWTESHTEIPWLEQAQYVIAASVVHKIRSVLHMLSFIEASTGGR